MLKITLFILLITLTVSTPIKYPIISHSPVVRKNFSSYTYSVPKVLTKNKVLISSFDTATNLFSINLTTLDTKTQKLKSNENLYKEVLIRDNSEHINYPEYILDVGSNQNYILIGVPNEANLTLCYIKTNFLYNQNITIEKITFENIFQNEENNIINSVRILPFHYSSKFLIITSYRKINGNEYDYYKLIVVDIQNNVLEVVKERDFLFNAWTYYYDEFVLKAFITAKNKIVIVKNGIRSSLLIITLNEDLIELYRNDDWLGDMYYFHKLELTHIIGERGLLCYNYKYEKNLYCMFLQIDNLGGIDTEKLREDLENEKNLFPCNETREYYLKTVHINNVILFYKENLQKEFKFKLFEDKEDVLVSLPDVDDKIEIKEGSYLNINMDIYENKVYILNEDTKGMTLYIVNLKEAISDYYENSFNFNLVIIMIGICCVLSLAYVIKVDKKVKRKNECDDEKENNNAEELIEILSFFG